MEPCGTILLADDEERLLKALGRALREAGHDLRTLLGATQWDEHGGTRAAVPAEGGRS